VKDRECVTSQAFDLIRLMSAFEVGYLIPVNQSSEEEGSVPKLAISDGTNVIGRNNIPVPDKRLSRKHLTLTAFRDGSANLIVVLTFTTLSFFTFIPFFFLFSICDFFSLC